MSFVSFLSRNQSSFSLFKRKKGLFNIIIESKSKFLNGNQSIRSNGFSYWSSHRFMSSQATPSMKILFGSQTGTAQAFAQELGTEGEEKNIPNEVIEMDTYDTNSIENDNLLVFIAATYGKGEPTDNAKNFVKWMQSSEAKQKNLKELEYTVFGLGKSKTYGDRYQAASKMLDEGMENLGAKRLLPRGEGDDDAE